jgi:TPR repeat protein
MKAGRLGWGILALWVAVDNLHLLAQQPPSVVGTNAAQELALWLSSVVTRTTKATGDTITVTEEYRTNAVSPEQFSAIKTEANQGDAVAQYKLGRLFGWGEGGETNRSKALSWLQKSAAQGLPEAQYAVGLSIQENDPAEAFRQFLRAADLGYSQAEFEIGMRYQTGDGVPEDMTEAAKWYRKAAEQGHADAQFSLGVLYIRGDGVVEDGAEAIRWWTKSAEQDDLQAAVRLGLCYSAGLATAKNREESLRWYRKAAAKGFVPGLLGLGGACEEKYQSDGGSQRDFDEAVECYRKAIDEGSVEGQRRLADIYWRRALNAKKAESLGPRFRRTEQEIADDYGETLRWLRRAADQGDPKAQGALGQMYRLGEGVRTDYHQALRWLRLSASQGDSTGQGNLGECYEEGTGVLQDFVEAYKWYVLASAEGGIYTVNRDAMAQKMTPEQIAKAQRRAAAFLAKKESSGREEHGEPGPTSREGLPPESSGTGFFITEDGFLVTNDHVVQGGDRFRLVTSAGAVDAKVVKLDPANDLALLKAEGKFPALPVATSRRVRLGGTVATVGFPNIGLQGFAPKLSKGEVAALSGAQDDPRYFQISVPVQPGNSGGALVDERGNVVGVVSAKLSAQAALSTSGALPENVNYAVKSSFLLSFLESVPDVSARLKEPSAKEQKFEDVVDSAGKAAVLVLVY